MKKFTQILGLAGLLAVGLAGAVAAVQQRLSPVVLAHFVVGGAFLAIGLLANLPEVKEWFMKRSVRMGPQVFIQGLLLVLVLSLLNVIVARHNWTKDLTRHHLFTLTRTTEEVMKNLPGEVEVIAFFPGGGPPEAVQRLELYASKFHKMKLRFVDPDKNESIARAEGVPPQMGVLFKFKDKRVWITKFNENDITNAFIKVTRESAPVVWFTTGHAEADLESKGPNGMAHLKEMLEQQGYKPEVKDLQTLSEIPEEVSMLAIVGPALPFARPELELIDSYLARGGNAVIFLDPVFDKAAITGLEAFLDPYGIRPAFNIVFEPESHLARDNLGAAIVATNLSNHPITEALTEPRVVMPWSRSLDKKELIPGNLILNPLVKTSPESYERILNPLGFPEFKNQEEANRFLRAILEGRPTPNERRGPFVLAYAITKTFQTPRWKKELGLAKAEKMRLVVCGSSAPPRNLYISMPFNYEFVMNIFNWLAGEKDLRYIRSPKRAGTRIYLDQRQKDRILYLSIMILPELFMVIGLAVWWRRR